MLFSTCVEYFRLVPAAKPNSKSVSLKFSLFCMCLENHHHQLVVEKALENKTHTCYFRCGECRHTILNQLPGRHTPVIHPPHTLTHTVPHLKLPDGFSYLFRHSEPPCPQPKRKRKDRIHIYIRISTLSSHSHIRQSHKS